MLTTLGNHTENEKIIRKKKHIYTHRFGDSSSYYELDFLSGQPSNYFKVLNLSHKTTFFNKKWMKQISLFWTLLCTIVRLERALSHNRQPELKIHSKTKPSCIYWIKFQFSEKKLNLELLLWKRIFIPMQCYKYFKRIWSSNWICRFFVQGYFFV